MNDTYRGEELPMPQEQLENLATYYETHSGADEPGAEHGEWTEPPTMVTVSIRVTERTRDALDRQAAEHGMRRTAYVRQALEDLTSAAPEHRESLEARVERLEAALYRINAV